MKIIIGLFTLTIFFNSCNSKQEKELVLDYEYIGQTDYHPDKKYDLRYDTLAIAFAGNFDNDTVNVKYCDTDSIIIMTTDEVDGLACDLRLGKIVDSYLILKVNDYKPIEIMINKENQLFLIEKYDSLIKIRPRYYLPGFY